MGWWVRPARAVERGWDTIAHHVDTLWDAVLYRSPPAPSARELAAGAAAREILVRHGLVDPAATAGETTVEGLLYDHLQARVVFHDVDYIYDPDDYLALLQEYAAATNGEWTLDHGRTTSRIGEDGELVRITFDHHGEQIAFDVRQYSDAVSPDFHPQLHGFTGTHLSGDYIDLSPGDQSVVHVYLPRSAAHELRAADLV
jgi:hypothetical protein